MTRKKKKMADLLMHEKIVFEYFYLLAKFANFDSFLNFHFSMNKLILSVQANMYLERRLQKWTVS